MFEAALFIIVKTHKKQLCLSADECIQRLWYIHTEECYSRVKKNKLSSYKKTRRILKHIF